jgi:phosphoribosylaminoimidazole-succinocarboxamide synthase
MTPADPQARSTVRETDLPGVPLVARGKVRDLYDLGDALLLVATDRLSAFDHVFPDPIPDKGRVLHQISAFWFAWSAPWQPNHVLETSVSRFPASLQAHAAQLEGRSLVARRLEMLPVECVARGYLAGSGWKEYQVRGTVCGIALPPGLRESDRLASPIFTPAAKSAHGHDENISFDAVVRLVGGPRAEALRARTLELYRRAVELAGSRGILIADTKLEFGIEPGGGGSGEGDGLVLADEVLTPDSSRFWPAHEYAPGGPQPSYDKQFVRDYLESIGWSKRPPVPSLPPQVIEGTRARYLEIFTILTGRQLV